MCCARAIVTAKAIADNHPQCLGFKRGRNIQYEAALLLHEEAHFIPGPCGIDELTRFALAPSLFLGYRIIMVDVDRMFCVW